MNAVFEHLETLLGVGVGELVEVLIARFGHGVSEVHHLVSSDSAGQFHVLLENCYSIGMDGTEVGVLEDSREVGFGSLL